MSHQPFPDVEFYLDDLISSPVSGNKLHKLAPNIRLAIAQGSKTIISFGGPYSNHLHALAWASKAAGLASIGYIRGELQTPLTPTLSDCADWGMRLLPLSRKKYRQVQENFLSQSNRPIAHSFLQLGIDLPERYMLLPEGGSNGLAIDSLAEAYRAIFRQDRFNKVTHVVCATGTGATLAGLYKAAPKNIQVIGIQAVAEGDATLNRIREWLCDDALENLRIVPGHLGGFAKRPRELMSFIAEFESANNVPLDPIYNGKVIYQLTQMINDQFFSEQDRVLVIHTGGLQGKRSN